MSAQPLEHLVLAQAVARGNRVRAALLRTRNEGLDAGLIELAPMLDELARVLDLSPTEYSHAEDLWPGLLNAASTDTSTGEARALFDLQSLCMDERREEPYDFVGWVRSGGLHAPTRPRPYFHQLRRLRHLRRAIRRMYASQAVSDDRLAATLEPAAQRLQDALFGELHPRIVAVLEGVGLYAPPEHDPRATYTQIADVLLERAVSQGMADFGDLRDAISRLPAKLTDLTREQLRQKDALLLADARLDEVLDGVYWRSELYLRLLHRFQSMIFGTPPGRLISRYVLGPFGIAYITLSFLEYVLDHVVGHFTFLTVPSVLGLGLIVCGIFNIPSWQAAFMNTIGNGLGRLLHGLTHGDPDPNAKPGRVRAFFAAVVRGYRATVDRVDAILYQLDEGIRFRGGERRGARLGEGLLLLLSFTIGYVLRFAFRLIIEPSLNPIKHFPIVTVVGKIALASGLPVMLAYHFSATMPPALAGTLAFLISLVFIPALAGFIVWEIRFNWRLYDANR